MDDDDSKLAAFIVAADAKWWDEAISKHNSRLKKGSASGRHISVAAIDSTGEGITATSLLNEALEAQAKFEARRGPLAELFAGISMQLAIHGRAIDLLFQQSPLVTNIVWGSVRLILQACGTLPIPPKPRLRPP